MRLDSFLNACRQCATHFDEGELVFKVYTKTAFIGESADIHKVEQMVKDLDAFELCVDKEHIDVVSPLYTHTTIYDLGRFELERDGEGYRVTEWPTTINGYGDVVKNHLQMKN